MHVRSKWFSVYLLLLVVILGGCASDGHRVEKLAKSTDKTAGEIVKVREIKREGETRAVISPADQKQLRITF